MPVSPVARALACTVALALGAVPARAVELVLDSVTASTSTGEVKLRLTTRASFDFDPGAAVLVSSGTWIAEYALPNQLTRFAHKVEDLRAGVEGQLSMKSYECVEGAFGAAFMNANICGNYGFGPNGIDEGGLADDQVSGPPKSLAGYRIADAEWNGETLVLSLEEGSDAGTQIFSESGFTLRFRAKPR